MGVNTLRLQLCPPFRFHSLDDVALKAIRRGLSFPIWSWGKLRRLLGKLEDQMRSCA